MSDRFRVSRIVARQLKDHGIPELAVLRRAGLWDGWLRQDKILATTEELFGFWRAVEEISGDATVGLRLGPNYSLDGGTPQTIAALHSESEGRQELAHQYLTDQSLELTEVAYLLGFADANSFFRAFQRQEGVSPYRWRCRRANVPARAGDAARR